MSDALAYLKHKLGRVKDSIEEFKKVGIFDKIMVSCFDKFIESKELKYGELSMALFSYRTSAAICENTTKDEPEEGKSYFIDFLNFIIKEFKRVISQNSHSSIETKLRAFELKTFIFNLMVEDLIVSVARNFGTEELSQVVCHKKIFKEQLDSTKICDLTSLLALMRHEKSLMDNVEIILSKDSIKDMTDIIRIMVADNDEEKRKDRRQSLLYL